MRSIVMMAVITCVVTTTMMTSQSSAARVDCGFPGIDGIRCMERGCLWDPVDVPRAPPAVGNEPWCYKIESGSDGDGEHSLGSAERESYKNARPIRLTNATVQFSGECLFHCTAVPRQSRIPCAGSDVTMGSCLRGGCCYDQSEPDPTRRCFHSSPVVASCPARECQVPSGAMEMCFGDDVTVSDDECLEKEGCCSVEVGTRKLCFRKEAPFAPVPGPDVSSSSAFLDALERQNVDTDSLSLLELLSKSEEQLVRENKAESVVEVTTTPAPTEPPTEPPTTPRTTTPQPTTQQPIRRRVCKWFMCRWQTVQPKAKKCFPAQCGIPRYYPGSPLTLPSKDASESSVLKKIVGGSRAYPFSHPWTAMFLKKEGERTFICGASVISDRWLVTAAHCMNRQTKQTNIPDLDTRYYEVHVGRYMGVDYEPGKQVQKFIGHEGIDRIVLHEEFASGVTRGIITHDIALIRLHKPITFNNFVQPICLPDEPTRENKILWATGWGDTRFQGPSNKNMKQLGVKVLNETVCDEQVSGFKESKPKGVICAGGEQRQDTCTGDSGGPLVGPKIETIVERRVRRQRYRWQLFGLTSIGSPSCNTRSVDRQPAIYTNVHYFKDWIAKHTQNGCA